MSSMREERAGGSAYWILVVALWGCTEFPAEAVDAAVAVDGASNSDGRPPRDAGRDMRLDASPLADLGEAPDTTTGEDARPRVDAEPTLDARPVGDAEPRVDVGPVGDAEPRVDVGPVGDAEPRVDAEPDAAVEPDASGPNPCTPNANGANACGTAIFFRCTPLPGGEARCEDLDECEPDEDGNNYCGVAVHWRCTNHDGRPPDCVDVDECAVNPDTGGNGCGIAEFWHCTDNRGAAPTCEDVDECAGGNGPCGDLVYRRCDNVRGGPPVCAAVDRCAPDDAGQNGCGEAIRFTCVHTDDQEPQCEDIDECLIENGGCGDAEFWRCENLRGEAPRCESIPQCAMGADGRNSCGIAEYWSCVEREGAAPGCSPLDLCAADDAGRNFCGVAIHWTCAQEPGQMPVCNDIDECQEDNGGCGPEEDVICENRIGEERRCLPVQRCPPTPAQRPWAVAQRDSLLWVLTSAAAEAWSVQPTNPATTSLGDNRRRVRVEVPDAEGVELLADALTAVVRPADADDNHLYEVDGLRGRGIDRDVHSAGWQGLPLDEAAYGPAFHLATVGPHLYALHGSTFNARLTRVDYDQGAHLDPAQGVRANLGGAFEESVAIGDAEWVAGTWFGRVVIIGTTGTVRDAEAPGVVLLDITEAVRGVRPYGDRDVLVFWTDDRVGVLEFEDEPRIRWLPIVAQVGWTLLDVAAPRGDGPVTALLRSPAGTWRVARAAPMDGAAAGFYLARPADGFPEGPEMEPVPPDDEPEPVDDAGVPPLPAPTYPPVRMVLSADGAWLAAAGRGAERVDVWVASDGAARGNHLTRVALAPGETLRDLATHGGHHRGRCDDRDDTCVGVATAGHFAAGAACRGAHGVCAIDGLWECDGAFARRCDVEPGGSNSPQEVEVCDGLDNDCDGAVDESQPVRRHLIAPAAERPGWIRLVAAPEVDAFYLSYVGEARGLRHPTVVRIDADGPGAPVHFEALERQTTIAALAWSGTSVGLSWQEEVLRTPERDHRLLRRRILAPDLSVLAELDEDQNVYRNNPMWELAMRPGYFVEAQTLNDWFTADIFDDQLARITSRGAQGRGGETHQVSTFFVGNYLYFLKGRDFQLQGSRVLMSDPIGAEEYRTSVSSFPDNALVVPGLLRFAAIGHRAGAGAEQPAGVYLQLVQPSWPLGPGAALRLRETPNADAGRAPWVGLSPAFGGWVASWVTGEPDAPIVIQTFDHLLNPTSARVPVPLSGEGGSYQRVAALPDRIGIVWMDPGEGNAVRFAEGFLCPPPPAQ